MSKKYLSYLMVAVSMVAVGWFSHSWYSNKSPRSKIRRVYAKGYRFTSPLLDVELPEGEGVNLEPLPFKHKVKDYISNQQAKGDVQDVAVYYRDLHDGPWFGINEDMAFDPGSMMKVPVMVAWLKRAEKDPNVLKEQIVYEYPEDMRDIQIRKSAKSVEPGQRYPVEELLQLMMNFSDNNATRLLYDHLKPEELDSVLDGMDVDNKAQDGANFVTAHSYSGLFRILYNAAFLNRAMSEKALQLLSMQDFPQGIVSGVAKGTVVAAKYGERFDETKKRYQLHEFGIVYHPRHAYILGVMTRGTNPGRLEEIISQISRIIYTEVDAGTFSQQNNR